MQTMTTRFIEITPAIAKAFLQNNRSNRNLVLSVVNKYARDMIAGKWKTTHQGILIGKNGTIIDGQHRLTAIARSGITCTMQVTVNEDLESALSLPLDMGHKRSTSTSLGISNQVAALCSFAFRTHRGISTIGIADIEPYLEVLRPVYELMTDGHRTSKSNITKAALHLAGCTQILNGKNPQYVQMAYKALLSWNLDLLASMPIVGSLHKQLVHDNTKIQDRELFVRAFRAFDPDNRRSSKLQIKNLQSAYEETRDIFVECIEKELKKI